MKLSGINLQSIDEHLEITRMKDEFEELHETEEFFTEVERELYDGLLTGDGETGNYIIQDEYINDYLY